MNKTFSIILFLIVVFFISFLIWFKDNGFGPGGIIDAENQKTAKTEYAYLLNFEFDKDDIISVEYPYTFSPDQNLLEITEGATIQENWEFEFEDYGDMGVLITQIGDKTNGQDQKYWQYFVAGEQPQISVDKYYPPLGTTIEWKFIKSEFL